MENEAIEAIDGLIKKHEDDIEGWNYLIARGDPKDVRSGWVDTWYNNIKEAEKKIDLLKKQRRILGPCEGC